MLDLLIKNAKVFQHDEMLDLGVKDGEIIYKEEAEGEEELESRKLINASNKSVVPGFIDSHIHFAKALTRKQIDNESGTLLEAIENFDEFYAEESEEDIYKRELEAAKMAVRNGTTAVRTHIIVNPKHGLKSIKPMLKLKEELKDLLDIQVIAFPSDPPKLDEKMMELLEKSLEMGADIIGGVPWLNDDFKDTIDKTFQLAKSYDVDIDLHVDESDEPDVSTLEYLAEKTIEENYEGRVTAGHCTALSAVDDGTAKRVMSKVKKANIHVITLPSCNMFLMGRDDDHPVRRGVTRVKEFLDLGVNLSYASDSIKDPFRPFGRGDMLEEGLFTAQVIQYGKPEEFKKIIEMGTYNPARTLGIDDYGLEVGNRADLVLLDAPTPEEALLNNSEKSFVIKNGKIVACSHRESDLLV